MLSAQTGGGRNAAFVGIFREAAKQLGKVIYSGDRQKVIDALNSAQFQFDKDGKLQSQSFKLDRFKKYWDFTLPADEMFLGLRI